MSTAKVSSPTVVREWALAEGLPVGKRGKFSAEVIAKFNKAHPRAKFSYGAFKPTITVQAGRIRKHVNVAEARAALAAQGVQVGKRGRLSQANLVLAVTGKAPEAPTT